MIENKNTNTLKDLLERELVNEVVDRHTNTAPQPGIQLQQATDFAESILWDLQRAFYTEQGIAAWRNGTVPHYVTSSSYMAASYAKMVYAWAKDQISAGHKHVRVIELGAGSGQFTFHFLYHLTELWDGDHLAEQVLPLTYAMSDLSAANREFWHTHPKLKRWFENGLLDSAHFDVETNDQLLLEKANQVWEANDQKGPVLVIANYVLDSIR